MTVKLGDFPHVCPEHDCAICRWVEAKQDQLTQVMLTEKRFEYVPTDKAIYQSPAAKVYRCRTCQRPIFSQHEGDDLPIVHCAASMGHTLEFQAQVEALKEDHGSGTP